MINKINTGIIGCNMSEDFFQKSSSNQMESFHWKKIFIGNSTAATISKAYPNAEMVSNVDAIINDNDITLVIVSANELGFVKQAIDAGKSVRVI